jgi:hypothetical protein
MITGSTDVRDSVLGMLGSFSKVESVETIP